MDLYIHSPIRLHGIVLNTLSTGTILPIPYLTLMVFKQFTNLSEIRYAHNTTKVRVKLSLCLNN
jgi:hypothetical protein